MKSQTNYPNLSYQANTNNAKEDENQKKDKEKKKAIPKLTFQEELKRVQQAFGDCEEPKAETVEVLEEYMFDFLDKFVTNCGKRMHRRDPNSSRIIKEDVLYMIKDDPKYMARLADIIYKKNYIAEIYKKKDPIDNTVQVPN